MCRPGEFSSHITLSGGATRCSSRFHPPASSHSVRRSVFVPRTIVKSVTRAGCLLHPYPRLEGQSHGTEPISVADVHAIKWEVHPDIDPILGINPVPEETVIACHVTDDSTVSYIGVEGGGWDILVEFSIAEFPGPQAAVTENLGPVVEWAETYYSSETFAVLERPH